MIEGYENMPFDLTNIYQSAEVVEILHGYFITVDYPANYLALKLILVLI